MAAWHEVEDLVGRYIPAHHPHERRKALMDLHRLVTKAYWDGFGHGEARRQGRGLWTRLTAWLLSWAR